MCAHAEITGTLYKTGHHHKQRIKTILNLHGEARLMPSSVASLARPLHHWLHISILLKTRRANTTRQRASRMSCSRQSSRRRRKRRRRTIRVSRAATSRALPARLESISAGIKTSDIKCLFTIKSAADVVTRMQVKLTSKGPPASIKPNQATRLNLELHPQREPRTTLKLKPEAI